jgi:hypothetical protein
MAAEGSVDLLSAVFFGVIGKLVGHSDNIRAILISADSRYVSVLLS